MLTFLFGMSKENQFRKGINVLPIWYGGRGVGSSRMSDWRLEKWLTLIQSSQSPLTLGAANITIETLKKYSESISQFRCMFYM